MGLKLHYHNHYHSPRGGALGALLLLLLPIFLPSLFSPLGHASPSMLSEWNVPKSRHQRLLKSALQRQTSERELSDLWTPLANQSLKPCAESSIAPSLPEKSEGFIQVFLDGGLNQQRMGICDAVAVAKILNATLVIPYLEVNPVWRDSSSFMDIFDVDHFINVLKDDISIVKELPSDFSWSTREYYATAIRATRVKTAPVHASANWYLENVLPVVQSYGIAAIAPFSHRLTFDNLPMDIQRLRCKVNFQALVFVPHIRALGDALISRLRNPSGKSGAVGTNYLQEMPDVKNKQGAGKFKGVASNLVTYLTDVMKMSNSAAAKTVNSWCGFTSMLPLLVAPFVDSYWDRYPTILASSFLYVAGLVALTSTALTRASSAANKTSSNSSFLFWSLYLISLGQGGYNPSLQAFGADQLDSEEELPSSKDEQKSNKKSVFFQWWYFGVCSGSLLGITLMSYIQDTFGWILGFAIPMISMVTSVVVFSCGSRIYTYRESEAMDYKPIGNMVQSIKATALKLMNRRITLPNKSDVTELELQEKPLCHQNFSTNEGLVENPKSGFYVLENAKVLLRLLPIWIMLLMFAVIFQQPPTFFTKQGMTMKRNIGSQFKIPPATLQSVITLSIILLMPLYDKIMIPITRLVTCHEKGITVMQRMGIGMFISVIAMASAAVVETRRLRISREMEALGAHSETVPFSIFWLLPQYILLGISDIFTVVGMQEFFYSEVPVRMRTMAFALYTSVFGVGSYLSSLLIATVEAVTSSNGRQSWFSDDMSEARLDKYYWFLASLSVLSFLLYVLLSACYRSRRDLDLDNENCK